MVVMVDDVAVPLQAQDGFETADHLASMTAPIVKWYWSIETTQRIPELLRRAFKFASTKPYRPVFLACPEDLLAGEGHGEHHRSGSIRRQHGAQAVRADAAARIAKLLVEARNPVVYAGDDVRYCGPNPSCLPWPTCYRYRFDERLVTSISDGPPHVRGPLRR